MWRKYLGLDEQTRAEKRAALGGFNLFFGALIGANLGAIEALPLNEYMLVVTIVCLIALYIQVAPVARKRWSTVATLAATVAALYAVLMSPLSDRIFDQGVQPEPHLFFTIALWLLSVTWLELRPVVDDPSDTTSVLPDE